jgi:lipopolysaccharide transport system ATP-binding protein
MKSYLTGKNIHIDFPVYENSNRSIKKTVINLTTGGKILKDHGNIKAIKAIDDISFNFKDGDRIGLCGHNGSGKTTLLRLLTGVYKPTSGVFNCKGKVASIIDLAMGLDFDATGYENIYLRGILSGLSRKEIVSKIEEIADFSELSSFLNFPVRTYSSGMLMRLAFSISTNIDADILIMDEWLSVGDAAFSKKATKKLNDLILKTPILIIASHDIDLIKRVCNRKIVLEHGKIASDLTF